MGFALTGLSQTVLVIAVLEHVGHSDVDTNTPKYINSSA